jgi:hypothetical protein
MKKRTQKKYEFSYREIADIIAKKQGGGCMTVAKKHAVKTYSEAEVSEIISDLDKSNKELTHRLHIAGKRTNLMKQKLYSLKQHHEALSQKQFYQYAGEVLKNI